LKITAAICTYNREKYLPQVLNSIACQTLAADQYEIIVVDNASTDETVETVQNTFPDVKLVQNQQNVGFGMANNQGFELAKNDLVLLLNTDAFIRPGCIEKLVD
jgi:GT2 family glycosyltransferase